MKKSLVQILGLTGIVSFLSYMAAVAFSPLAYPGYDWMKQAVSDLSAASSPSLPLWNSLTAFYNVCEVLCATVVCNRFRINFVCVHFLYLRCGRLYRRPLVFYAFEYTIVFAKAEQRRSRKTSISEKSPGEFLSLAVCSKKFCRSFYLNS